MARQDQSVEGGTAYQARGNLTVTNGMDAAQMASVMLEMGKQLHVYLCEAETKVEERLAEFRQSVMEEFSKPENSAKTDAFRDPDFQFVLSDAQKVYVRDGEQELKDHLVKLLVQRSQLDSKERTAKILNFAIEVAGSLSKNEYAALAISFLFTNVRLETKDRSALINQYSSFIAPFYADLSDNQTVYEYLEAQRCGAINHLITRELIGPLHQRYSSMISYGFDPKLLEDFSNDISTQILQSLSIPAAGYKGYVCFKQSDPTDFASELRELGASNPTIDRVTNLHTKVTPTEHEFRETMCEEIEGFDRVLQIWESTALSKLSLTAVGKTIAHSSLTSRSDFNAPLSIWVQ
ncbi:MAG TPA: LPO_1073/Vpar_1526 family protein [Allosphingosinicella sp.]|jgi:hypothetical protein